MNMSKTKHSVHFSMDVVSTEDVSENVTSQINPGIEPSLYPPPRSNRLRKDVSDYSDAKLKTIVAIVILAIVFVSCLISWLLRFAKYGE